MFEHNFSFTCATSHAKNLTKITKFDIYDLNYCNFILMIILHTLLSDVIIIRQVIKHFMDQTSVVLAGQSCPNVLYIMPVSIRIAQSNFLNIAVD